MKRMLLVLLVIALCIPCGALAEGMLKIVNCQDWVSLRSAPSTRIVRADFFFCSNFVYLSKNH